MTGETKVPGLKAQHAIITPDCRTVERPGLDADPATAAFEEAVARLRREYTRICEARDDPFDAHLVLTVDDNRMKQQREGCGTLVSDEEE